MALVKIDHLKNYLRLNYNVLFSGLHGIGKTAIIEQVFKEEKLNWKYFSASTLDPWVDLIGVPDTTERDPATGQKYLELVRPEFIVKDEVQAIFFDEINRAPPKVLNAIMELIQFKSINGHKLKNLRVVWAAINPEDDDDTYSVTHLDPAQVDRFHVHMSIPFKVDEDYFMKKYPQHGRQFIDWWNELPDDMKKLVSPRRLDYAAAAHLENCRLEDFLPYKTGVKKLREALKVLPFESVINAVKDVNEAEALLKNGNHVTKLLDMLSAKNTVAIAFFETYGKLLPKDLCAPFVQLVYAATRGAALVKNFEEIIDRLPDNEKGTSADSAFINGIDMSVLYANGGSLQNDMRTLKIQKNEKMKKLANRCIDIIFSCRHETLERQLWGNGGKAGGKATNFQTIVATLSLVDKGYFSPAQRQKINQKVYDPNDMSKRLIQNMNWI